MFLLLYLLALQVKLITFNFSGMGIPWHVKFVDTKIQGSHCPFPSADLVTDWHTPPEEREPIVTEFKSERGIFLWATEIQVNNK